MADTPEMNTVPAPEATAAPATYTASTPAIPAQYRPLSPWAYFGLSLLYSVPVVGFIFLIIFSFKSSNLNRRNFTRSYWCGLIIVAAIVGLILILGLSGAIFIPIANKGSYY